MKIFRMTSNRIVTRRPDDPIKEAENKLYNRVLDTNGRLWFFKIHSGTIAWFFFVSPLVDRKSRSNHQFVELKCMSLIFWLFNRFKNGLYGVRDIFKLVANCGIQIKWNGRVPRMFFIFFFFTHQQCILSVSKLLYFQKTRMFYKFKQVFFFKNIQSFENGV